MGKIIGGVIVVVAIVTLWFLWSRPAETPTTLPQSVTESEETGDQATAPNQIVNSLKEAMGLGRTMQCTYALDGDGGQATTLVEGDKFKTVTVTPAMTAYGLFDGATQYMWTDRDTKGYKMSKDCLEELSKSAPTSTETAPTPSQPTDLKDSFDLAQNVKCEPVASADFTLPGNIVFTDQCAMMKESLDALKNIKMDLPAGVTLPSMPSQY